MNLIAVAALTGASLALPALALPAYAQMTEARCAFSWGLIGESIQLAPETAPPVLEGDRCVARGLIARAGRLTILVDELGWRLDGLEALLVSQRLPDRAEVSVRGLRIATHTEIPMMDYVLQAQARAGEGISGDLVATQSEGHLVLERLDVDFPGDNAVSARAVADGAQLTDPRAAVLREMSVEITSHGLFETYALMPLANMVLDSYDSADTQAEARRAETLAAIETLPEPVFPAASRTAMAVLVEDLPNPAGTLSIRLDAPGGVPLAQLENAARFIGQVPLDQLLTGIGVIVDYDRDGGQ